MAGQPSHTSAVIPFASGGCTTLPEGTDEYRTSIKRFNFSKYYHGIRGLSTLFDRMGQLCEKR